MLFITKALYDLFLRLYRLGVEMYASRDEKAKQWIEGRKDLLQKIESALEGKDEKRVWFHSASLGEFEQGRPLIEKLKQQHPELKIFLTFFSPSGYEIRKNYPFADYVFYLPMDSPAAARKFVEMVNPSFAVFIKYEFWLHYFEELHERHIPLILLSAIFRDKQPFFHWYGNLHRQMLKDVTHFFVQDKQSKELLSGQGFHNVTVIPDTRIDRVSAIHSQQRSLGSIEGFLKGAKALIAGSAYDTENRLLHQAFRDGLVSNKIIIAPHQVDQEHISKIAEVWQDEAVLYSRYNSQTDSAKRVLIIDSIGILSALYRYGSMALIGGGFGKGIHNILEPAAFGLPVLMGPHYHKFREAEELITSGGAFEVKDEAGLSEVLVKLSDTEVYRKASLASADFIRNNTGGTETVYRWLLEAGLLA